MGDDIANIDEITAIYQQSVYKLHVLSIDKWFAMENIPHPTNSSEVELHQNTYKLQGLSIDKWFVMENLPHPANSSDVELRDNHVFNSLENNLAI